MRVSAEKDNVQPIQEINEIRIPIIIHLLIPYLETIYPQGTEHTATVKRKIFEIQFWTILLKPKSTAITGSATVTEEDKKSN